MQTPNFDSLKVNESHLIDIRRGLLKIGSRNVFVTFLGHQKQGGVVLKEHLPYTTIQEKNWGLYQRNDVLKFVLCQNYVYRINEIKQHEHLPVNARQAVAILENVPYSMYGLIGSTDITNNNLLELRSTLGNILDSLSVVLLVASNLQK